jgi:hypothetical protein
MTFLAKLYEGSIRKFFCVLKYSYRAILLRFKILFFGLYHPRYYPRDIRRLSQNITTTQTENGAGIDRSHWSFLKISNEREKSDLPLIRLAGLQVPVDDISYYWRSDCNHAEAEVLSASHRFHWILEWISRGFSSDDCGVIAGFVTRWLDQYSSEKNGIAWQPYAVSERICNLTVFLFYLHDKMPGDPLSSRLIVKIKEHALFLAENLEYPASGEVNNHILNNGRALYLSGMLLGMPQISALGRSVMTRHLPEMISESGYLNEGSSHYQLLLTRSILECEIIARVTRDQSFANFLRPIAESMLGGSSRLFKSSLIDADQGPRVGDVSPDVSFDWFLPMKSCFWETLWNSKVQAKTLQIADIEIIDGWLSAEVNNWGVCAFIHPDNTSYPVGHSHQDFGSFWMSHNGCDLIVDVGRLSYETCSEHSQSGVEARSHSIALVNGRAILEGGKGWQSCNTCETAWSVRFSLEDDKEIVWSVKSKQAKWQRTLSLQNNAIIISDEIEPFNDNAITECTIPLSPMWSLDKVGIDRWFLSSNVVNQKFSILGSDNVVWSSAQTSFYSEYGVSCCAPSLQWRHRGDGRKFIVSCQIILS